METIPRPEYPRPQFQRDSWLNLNGTWTCEFDPGRSGLARGLAKSTGFATPITVPFCPESALSGLSHTDFIEAIFYHRKITVPADWAGKRLLLHFGAVDYECTGFLDGAQVGHHYGGSASFAFDITAQATPGKPQDFVLAVTDLLRDGVQPGGKQCPDYKSYGCFYTRTTGIWQTVWLEAVHPDGLAKCQITPDLDGQSFAFQPFFFTEKRNRHLRITVSAEGRQVGSALVPGNSAMPVTVKLSEIRPWSPDAPFLYDIEYEVLEDEKVIDTVAAYAGLRKIHIEGHRIFLNNSPVFLRLVLDQGFYREGIWTAPSDEALKHDIELSMAAGFNGARLHQKVFEERFHYWADRLGYLTWGESPSWGVTAFWDIAQATDVRSQRSLNNFLHEWKEIVGRDYNHPSIIAWTPANECSPGDQDFYRRTLEELYDVTKLLDPTRPCNETSGYHHVKTDLWTIHFYRPTAQELNRDLHPENAPVPCLKPDFELPAYHGQPFLNDEFGGFLFLPPDITGRHADNTWGYYGLEIKTAEDFIARIAEQVKVMVQMPECSGFCYTQLTDIEQEQNGIYTYDRLPKAPVESLRKAFAWQPDDRR